MTTARQDREFREAIISDALLDDAIEWIKNNLTPEDVFEQHQLEEWASREGFVLSEE